jgi:hypothetical protein
MKLKLKEKTSSMLDKTVLKENLNSLVCCSIEGVWGRFASPWVRVFGREHTKTELTLYIRKIWESCV